MLTEAEGAVVAVNEACVISVDCGDVSTEAAVNAAVLLDDVAKVDNAFVDTLDTVVPVSGDTNAAARGDNVCKLFVVADVEPHCVATWLPC